MFRAVAPVAFVLFPAVALAGGSPDGGSRDGSAGCGTVTFQGECQGNVLVYCDEDTNSVQTIDCEADVATGAMCQEIDVDYGYDCALAVGDGCVDDDGNIYLCQGTMPGCFEDPTGAVCTENLGTCVEADVDTCNGNQWIYACNVNQPYIVDCAEYGGTCGTRPGRCLGIGVGGFCGEGLECADGLVCGTLGACEMNVVRDGGVARDGGTTAPRDGGPTSTPGPGTTDIEDGGCGCTTTGAPAAAWSFAALAVLLLVRIRRQK